MKRLITILTLIGVLLLTIGITLIVLGVVVKPIYSSSADLFVHTLDCEDGNITASDLEENNELIYSYARVLESNFVLEDVADEINTRYGTELTVSTIQSTLDFSIPEGTNLLRITCSYTDPALAEAICNSLCGMAPSVLEETCGVNTAKQVGPATQATLNNAFNVTMRLVGIGVSIVAFHPLLAAFILSRIKKHKENGK